MTIFVPRPPPGTYAGSLAPYHRLRVVSTHDGLTFKPADIGFLDDWAGSNLSGSAISSVTAVGLASDAFDGNPVTWPTFNLSDNPYIGLDHSTAVRVIEFYMQAPSLGDETAMPSEMVLEESTDNITWTPVRTYTDIPPWRYSETLFFPVADESLAPFDGKWRYQRVRAETTPDGSVFGVGDIQFYASPGDSATIAGDLEGSFVVSGGTVLMDDGSSFTICDVTLASGGWFRMWTGRTPVDQIQEIRLQAQWDAGFALKMPTDFFVEGSNWYSSYDLIQTYNTPGWSPFNSRRFSVP